MFIYVCIIKFEIYFIIIVRHVIRYMTYYDLYRHMMDSINQNSFEKSHMRKRKPALLRSQDEIFSVWFLQNDQPNMPDGFKQS